MSKYVFQLRRGTRCVDETGATLKNPDGTAVRDDWAVYSNQDGHVNPLEGELVLEYELYEDGRKIPRLKIGDGVSEFSELEYLSVDSFIMPKPAYVHLDPKAWVKATDDRYYQVVKVQNATITPRSKVDLQPSSEQLCVFHQKDLAFVAENEDRIVRVYCVGQVPQNEYTIQAVVTEVLGDE